MAVGVIGWIAALRNTTTAVSPIAEVNHYILPIWLIVLGMVLIRWRAESSGASTVSMCEAA